MPRTHALAMAFSAAWSWSSLCLVPEPVVALAVTVASHTRGHTRMVSGPDGGSL